MTMLYPLRVLAAPRSGTLYTAKVLRHHGWQVGWEHFGDHGLVSWMAAAESEDVPFGRAPTAGCRFGHTVAIVREPLQAIASIAAVCLAGPSRAPFTQYARRFVILPAGAPPLAMAAWFWLGWQRLIAAQRPEAYFRSEDRHGALLEYLADKMPPPGVPLEGLPATTTHARKGALPIAREDVARHVPGWLMRDIDELAVRWGYR